jgi:exopolyphosphatase/guanosine-5'-triphosphate,3'-diphosphate pyrophosphatase
MLSILLRLAEMLDRSHTRAVSHARLCAVDGKTLALEVLPVRDIQLELWGLRTREGTLAKALGRKLVVRVTQ